MPMMDQPATADVLVFVAREKAQAGAGAEALVNI